MAEDIEHDLQELRRHAAQHVLQSKVERENCSSYPQIFGWQLLFLLSWITRLFSSIHSTLCIVILHFLLQHILLEAVFQHT
jgi:hypothetical protein